MPEKYFPHYYTTSSSLKHWNKAEKIHWFMLLMSKFDQLLSYCPIATVPTRFIFFFWADMWSSAAVAHPLQGLMCCAFRDVVLHVTVQLCGYFSYCRLPVSLNQSGRSSVTSLITRPFHPQNWHSLLFLLLLFFQSFSVNPRGCCARNSNTVKHLSVNVQYISGYLLLFYSSWIIYNVTSQWTGAGKHSDYLCLHYSKHLCIYTLTVMLCSQ